MKALHGDYIIKTYASKAVNFILHQVTRLKGFSHSTHWNKSWPSIGKGQFISTVKSTAERSSKRSEVIHWISIDYYKQVSRDILHGKIHKYSLSSLVLKILGDTFPNNQTFIASSWWLKLHYYVKEVSRVDVYI